MDASICTSYNECDTNYITMYGNASVLKQVGRRHAVDISPAARAVKRVAYSPGQREALGMLPTVLHQ